jgi:16S rRNA (guanine(966)-N(2))-methyltransferase RsmD
MRVIAGTNRGKKLAVPPGISTRPTSDRVKEALFSILESRIDFASIRVLDICAGTGSLGIEALSRGAESCCFIESDKSVKSILDKNLQVTSGLEQSQILNMDVIKALKLVAGRNNNFDLVFFDPPYASELYKIVLDAVDFYNILAPGAILVAECAVRNSLAESFGRLRRFDRRVYGETALELFVLEEK